MTLLQRTIEDSTATIRALATVDLLVPGDNTARIREAHTVLFHVLCETVDYELPR